MDTKEYMRRRELGEWSKAKARMATLSTREAWLLAKECWLKLAKLAEVEQRQDQQIDRK